MNFPRGAVERPLQPCLLRRVDRPRCRCHGTSAKRSVWTRSRAPAETLFGTVLGGGDFVDQLIDPRVGSARHPRSASTRAPISRGGRRLEEGCRKRLEGVVPVVIAPDGVDRYGSRLERQPEVRLVVLHRPGRVQTSDDTTTTARPIRSRPPELITKYVLGRIAFARVADDDEGEVSVGNPVGATANFVVVAQPPLPGQHAAHPSPRARIGGRFRPEFHIAAAQFSVSKYQFIPRRERSPRGSAATGGRSGALADAHTRLVARLRVRIANLSSTSGAQRPPGVRATPRRTTSGTSTEQRQPRGGRSMECGARGEVQRMDHRAA